MAGVGEEKNDEDENEEPPAVNEMYDKEKRERQHFYAALHLQLYTGFYRLLPSRDFPYELGVGYALELFLSVIPMLFCQVFNNAETDGLTSLQSAAMILKLILMATLLVEVAVMIWEIIHNRQMRKLGQEGYKKLPEEKRRGTWGVKLSVVAVIAMGAFIIILIIGVLTTSARACQGTRQALEGATCVDCQDAHCLNCLDDSKKCTGCDAGFTLMPKDMTCRDCDVGQNKDGRCVKCKPDGDSVKCEECKRGYRLAGGKCIPCKVELSAEQKTKVVNKDKDNLANAANYEKLLSDASDNCATCDDPTDCAEKGTCGQYKCSECKPGSRMKDGLCFPCSQDLHHCKSCKDVPRMGVNSEGRRVQVGVTAVCAQCDTDVARMVDGQCGSAAGGCRKDKGWVWSDSKDRCDCVGDGTGDAFITQIEGEGVGCKTCNTLFPGCKKCDRVAQGGEGLYLKIGSIDKVFASMGKHEGSDEELNEFVRCSECGSNMHHDRIKTRKKDAKGDPIIEHRCTACDSIIKGCRTCDINAEGKAIGCKACKRSYQLEPFDETQRCSSCRKWGTACTRCTLKDGCINCSAGYNIWMNYCWKKIW